MGLTPRTMSIAEAREKLTSLPARFEESPDSDVVAVTRYGQPVLAIMPWELYETLVETLEVLSDEELMGQLKHSIGEALRGETIGWAKVKKDLGL